MKSLEKYLLVYLYIALRLPVSWLVLVTAFVLLFGLGQTQCSTNAVVRRLEPVTDSSAKKSHNTVQFSDDKMMAAFQAVPWDRLLDLWSFQVEDFNYESEKRVPSIDLLCMEVKNTSTKEIYINPHEINFKGNHQSAQAVHILSRAQYEDRFYSQVYLKFDYGHLFGFDPIVKIKPLKNMQSCAKLDILELHPDKIKELQQRLATKIAKSGATSSQNTPSDPDSNRSKLGLYILPPGSSNVWLLPFPLLSQRATQYTLTVPYREAKSPAVSGSLEVLMNYKIGRKSD